MPHLANRRGARSESGASSFSVGLKCKGRKETSAFFCLNKSGRLAALLFTLLENTLEGLISLYSFEDSAICAEDRILEGDSIAASKDSSPDCPIMYIN